MGQTPLRFMSNAVMFCGEDFSFFFVLSLDFICCMLLFRPHLTSCLKWNECPFFVLHYKSSIALPIFFEVNKKKRKYLSFVSISNAIWLSKVYLIFLSFSFLFYFVRWWNRALELHSHCSCLSVCVSVI